MIYVYVDPAREYLSVTAQLVETGELFTLCKLESPDPKSDASAYWSTDKNVRSAWDAAGVKKHDTNISKPGKRRDGGGAGPSESGTTKGP